MNYANWENREVSFVESGLDFFSEGSKGDYGTSSSHNGTGREPFYNGRRNKDANPKKSSLFRNIIQKSQVFFGI